MFLTISYCGQSLGPLCANTVIWLNKYIIYYRNGDIFDNEMGLFFLICHDNRSELNHFPANLKVNNHTYHPHSVNGKFYLSFQADFIISLFVADMTEVPSCLFFLNIFSTAEKENITGKSWQAFCLLCWNVNEVISCYPEKLSWENI